MELIISTGVEYKEEGIYGTTEIHVFEEGYLYIYFIHKILSKLWNKR